MPPVRVAIVCDLREEEWHSMDLIGDMLISTLPAIANGDIAATRLCPPMARRWTRLPVVGASGWARLGDRLTGRLRDYPKWLAPRSRDFDVFHIVDHSYAHLVRVLPADRTIVTCNDTDAIRAALPGAARPLDPARLLASRVLDGLAQAGRVACISRATRSELLASGRVSADRVSVVHLGVHPSCSPCTALEADAEIERCLGPRVPEILHVGSTIPRKRIETLIEILAQVRGIVEGARLVRVGGRLTAPQRGLAKQRGVDDAIVEMPFLDRPLLAAVYRRAAVVALPSEREGFGLPVAEAMSCGTPVVASDIASLREVGAQAAVYCPVGDVAAWTAALIPFLRDHESDRAAREERRRAGIVQASRFSWQTYAAEMKNLYLAIQ